MNDSLKKEITTIKNVHWEQIQENTAKLTAINNGLMNEIDYIKNNHWQQIQDNTARLNIINDGLVKDKDDMEIRFSILR